ncbi:uncharacterized protein K460DRAFT_416277 [Cucurbitaria berberidis CBS 394.84]|uniref:Uncharacterized protein n=1 Tax=Cucurbitaria berberidis CBS 394.84 TaxID=1168544 RepID=A0A9P4GF62_9PLEO|nr:uncharacterized protein K460DRAFT_416277 [Cucurbitaria berberidis CBS 394.84]KAF1844923.1 hypothetical protein K460DRAFT_416277 [Cucurbitaria berberidis CBS 394.84]
MIETNSNSGDLTISELQNKTVYWIQTIDHKNGIERPSRFGTGPYIDTKRDRELLLSQLYGRCGNDEAATAHVNRLVKGDSLYESLVSAAILDAQKKPLFSLIVDKERNEGIADILRTTTGAATREMYTVRNRIITKDMLDDEVLKNMDQIVRSGGKNFSIGGGVETFESREEAVACAEALLASGHEQEVRKAIESLEGVLFGYRVGFGRRHAGWMYTVTKVRVGEEVREDVYDL